MSLSALFRKLEARDALAPEEKLALEAAAASDERFSTGDEIVGEGRPQTISRLLVEGMCARSKTLEDGRRQFTELHIAGDFVDLHSFLLKRLDHDIVALTPVRMINFSHAALRGVTERQPHLTRMLWLSTLMDAALHRAWIVSAGRRSATEQIASLFCELMLRFDIVGMAEGRRCPLPLTQNQLADACGLSSVHVNRVIQELREAELIEWRGGVLTILNFDRLAAVSKFDPSYLTLVREPR